MKRYLLRFSIGLLVGVFLLVLMFRDTDWAALGDAMRTMDLGMAALALALSFASLFIRVWRWEFVVSASRPVRFRSLFSATQIGLLVNTVIPARVGDFVRAWVLTSLERIPLAGSLTLVALDRINDILALLIVLLLAVYTFPGNRDIEFPAGAFGNSEPFVVSSGLIEPVASGLTLALFAVLVVLVALYVSQEGILRLINRFVGKMSPGLAGWVGKQFEHVAEGMHVLGSARRLVIAVLLSVATWGAVAVSFACLFAAFGIDFPWYGPVFLLAILGVFTSVTVSPGMVGQYHVPVVAALLMIAPDTDIERAKAFAIVAHLVAFVPPIVLGVWSMVTEKIGVRDLFPVLERSTDASAGDSKE